MFFALAILPFLTPGIFAAGVAATSIPIIIHLLNRRRFRTIIWAAMDFLLAAQRRNARRLRFQRWLLLILRIVTLLILAAAIAQLTLNHTVAAILGGSERGLIVLWDDSYSMGYHSGAAPSAFEKSRKLLTEWIAHVPASDRVALLHASTTTGAALVTPTLDHRALARTIKEATLTDAGTDLAGALDRAAALAESVEPTTRQRQVILLTDCTRATLGTGSGDKGQALKKAVEKVKRFATLRVIDVGQPKQFNLGITQLETARPVIVAGHSTDFRISVYNAFDTPQQDIPLSLTVDGVVVASEKIARIEPGSARDLIIAYNITTPARHVVEAKLTTPRDPLEVDDTRRLIANVVRELPVLLVDGSPGDAHTLGASTFLEKALAPVVEGKNLSVFAPHVITELELPRTPLTDSAAVALIDTAAPDGPTNESLRKYVENGGLLLLFPGNRTNGEALNRTLGDGGAKLLPAAFGPTVKLDAAQLAGAGLHLDPQNYTHPVLDLFGAAVRNNINPGLSTVQAEQYIRLTIPADRGAETILKFSDGSPAVVLGHTGRGKVVMFATTADTTWNTWGALPSYAPFMHELLHYGMARQADAFTLPVGGQLHLPADVAPPGNWTAPHNTTLSVSTMLDKDNGGRSYLTSGVLPWAGVYAPPGAGGTPVVAVNTDPAEADTRHVAAPQMAAALGVELADVVTEPKTLEMPTTTAGRDTSGDVGRNLIPLALALLLLETFLARRFSMYR